MLLLTCMTAIVTCTDIIASGLPMPAHNPPYPEAAIARAQRDCVTQPGSHRLFPLPESRLLQVRIAGPIRSFSKDRKNVCTRIDEQPDFPGPIR